MQHDPLLSLRSMLYAHVAALSFAPTWVVALVVVVAAVVAAWLLHAAIVAILRRIFHGQHPYLQSILDKTGHPTRLALLLIALAITLPIAPLGADTKVIAARAMLLATICLIGWTTLIVMHIGANLYLMRFRIDTADNLMARKHLTQVRLLVRVLDTIIVMVTLGLALMTFDAVRQYGVSLFASAGVAGVVFGLAAQPVLSNLIAGVQLALTEPIRLEDAVTVQNEYGWIEEINATYVVIRLWDLRRLIVPLNFFIQQPFYNWTRQASAILSSALLYLDYGAPIDLIRREAIAIVEKSGRANTSVASVQVTNVRPDSIELRILVKSDSPGKASDTCADLREQLIGFLQREHPEALPRQRSQTIAALQQNDAAPGASGPHPGKPNSV